MVGSPFIRKACTLFVASVGFASVSMFSASAQLDLSTHGTNYFENFNSISNGLPEGWSVRISATASGAGTATTFTTSGTSWGNLTGQFANYASTISNPGTNFLGTESTTAQGACTNRAVGVRQTGATGMDPGSAFVLQLLNTTNRYNLKLNFDFLTLSVQGRFATWTVDYALGSNPSSFTPIGTIEYPRIFGRTNVNFSFGSALDNQSGPVWIRVVALTAASGTSNRDTIAMDDFSLSWDSDAAPIVEVPSCALNIAMIDGAAVVTWTNSIFNLQASGGCSDGFTNVLNATSPFTNLMQNSQMFFRLVHTNGN